MSQSNAWVDGNGRVYFVYTIQQMAEDMEKERKERKEQEHRQEVKKNIKICFPERAMRDWIFTNDDGSNPYMKYAK